MGTNQLAIYGGGTLASSYSDAWLLDLDALHWKPLDAALAPVGSAKKEADPEPRVEHAGAVVGGRWVVVGGAGDGRDCTGCR